MNSRHKNQKGNVLFLILIAVALFAALSYAVTQSSRSGGDAGRETNILNSAQLTQYPNQIRTAILRLVIDGRSMTSLEFNDPSDFETPANSVFHPEGGGAVYQEAPSDMMDDGNPGVWSYNLEFEVPEIGITDAASLAGNDLIAFLPGIRLEVCQRLNHQGGVTAAVSDAPPVIGSDLSGTSAGDYGVNMDDAYSVPSTGIALDNSAEDFTGKPFGCFENGTAGDGTYVYYHVLYER